MTAGDAYIYIEAVPGPTPSFPPPGIAGADWSGHADYYTPWQVVVPANSAKLLNGCATYNSWISPGNFAAFVCV